MRWRVLDLVLNHCTRSLSSDYGAILPRTGVEARQGKQQNEDGWRGVLELWCSCATLIHPAFLRDLLLHARVERFQLL